MEHGHWRRHVSAPWPRTRPSCDRCGQTASAQPGTFHRSRYREATRLPVAHPRREPSESTHAAGSAAGVSRPATMTFRRYAAWAASAARCRPLAGGTRTAHATAWPRSTARGSRNSTCANSISSPLTRFTCRTPRTAAGWPEADRPLDALGLAARNVPINPHDPHRHSKALSKLLMQIARPMRDASEATHAP